MQSARIHEYGDASVIRLDDVPRPVPAPDEVLIHVAATSFNPTEVALRSGFLATMFPTELPYTLGWDVSGTVVEVGAEVHAFAVDDQVIGRLDGGAAAQYAIAKASILVPAPTGIPLADAAAIPLAGLTAWQAVFERARVSPDQRVLINGAGGGIGGFTVQLAKHAGAEVIATASPRSAGTVRRYGADHVIDYTADESWHEPVDVVLNLVDIKPPQIAELMSLIKPGGVFVSVASQVEPPADGEVTASHMVARNDVAHLAKLVELVDMGVVIVDVAESFPLTELAVVHRRCEAGDTRGKITIIP